MNSTVKIENITNIKPLDNIVIFASGKGSRLMPLTNYIPKFLVNIKNECMLNKIVNFWNKYTKQFTIVINTKYHDIVKFYLDLLNIKYKIICIDIINQENSYTIHKALDKTYYNQKVLFTWCDLCPLVDFNFNLFNGNNIIFTYKNFGRYDAIEEMNEIIIKKYGNVIGIYYFSNYQGLNIFEPKQDLCDCYLYNYKSFNTYEIENLIDIGDMKKLDIELAKTKLYKTRYFNEITEINNNRLWKQSICDYGDNIINNEMNFYKNNTFDFIPKIYKFNEKSFIMNKINGKVLGDCLEDYNHKEQKYIINKCINIINIIHSSGQKEVSKEIYFRDLDIEFDSKVRTRLNNVNELITFHKNISYVNGIFIQYDKEYILNDLCNYIKEKLLNKQIFYYNKIHGDPHLSNILIDNHKKIYVIDPRGYFGKSKLYGLKEYDISKILYSLSGFDEINNNQKYFYTIEGDNLIINLTNNMDMFLDIFNKYDLKLLISMVILHWFGLTDYTKDNISKCIGSYYYAIYLYNYYKLQKVI